LLSGVVLRSQSDERLVALARAGHDQAFVAIAQRYRRELIAHARRLVPADRSEDIVQQAMLNAWSALRRERRQPALTRLLTRPRTRRLSVASGANPALTSPHPAPIRRTMEMKIKCVVSRGHTPGAFRRTTEMKVKRVV
jgi:hypothetical protein